LPHPLYEFVPVVLRGIAQAALERFLPPLPLVCEFAAELAAIREPPVVALRDVEDARDVLEDAGRFLCLRDLVLLLGLLLQRRAPVLDRGDALVEPGRDLAAPALAEGRRVLPLPLRAVGDQHRDPGPDPLQGAGAVAHQLS